MKKLAFAILVFGLIALFPIVAILELNRTTGVSDKNNSPVRPVEKTEVTNATLNLKNPGKMADDEFSLTPKLFLLNNLLKN